MEKILGGGYVAPEIEVMHVVCEQGFAQSVGVDDANKVEGEWD